MAISTASRHHGQTDSPAVDYVAPSHSLRRLQGSLVSRQRRTKDAKCSLRDRDVSKLVQQCNTVEP